jgi:hypothetical protein
MVLPRSYGGLKYPSSWNQVPCTSAKTSLADRGRLHTKVESAINRSAPRQNNAAEMEKPMGAHPPITPDMTVADVIAQHPNAIDLLAAQHSAFERLRNPLLRKAFSRLVTLRQAAAIAGFDLAALLAALNGDGGSALPAAGALDAATNGLATRRDGSTRPAWRRASTCVRLCAPGRSR